MLKLFTKYASVGVLNTALHWIIFSLCVFAFHTTQTLANVAGFAVAVSFSFFANARFTFKSSTSPTGYILYVGFMGALSAVVGWVADECAMAPIMTLVAFSAISLISGFFYSRYIVFRNRK